MAFIDTLINQLSSPASNDRLVASDTSATALEKDKYLELSQVGMPSLANTWTADQTFSGNVILSGTIGPFVVQGGGTLTIASGAITVPATGIQFNVDTEGAAAADDLVTINGGATNRIIIVRILDSSRDVTIKNGTGNIRCGVDRVLNTNQDLWMAMFNAGVWCELVFSNNS